jgi:hypothetical protein
LRARLFSKPPALSARVESVTGKIYEHSKSIKNYLIANDLPAIDVKTLGERVSTNRSDPKHVFRVTVIDSVEEYLSLLKTVSLLVRVSRLLTIALSCRYSISLLSNRCFNAKTSNLHSMDCMVFQGE